MNMAQLKIPNAQLAVYKRFLRIHNIAIAKQFEQKNMPYTELFIECKDKQAKDKLVTVLRKATAKIKRQH